MKREEMNAKIIKKAIDDPKFKESVLQDAKNAVKEVLGHPLPGNMKVQVLQETADKIYIVLPHVLEVKDGELSDEALEAVAGGGPYKVESLNYDKKGNCT